MKLVMCMVEGRGVGVPKGGGFKESENGRCYKYVKIVFLSLSFDDCGKGRGR